MPACHNAKMDRQQSEELPPTLCPSREAISNVADNIWKPVCEQDISDPQVAALASQSAQSLGGFVQL